MGEYLLDQYSLLHFAVGIIFYYWNVSFSISLIIHIIFELFENTQFGMLIINKVFVGKHIFNWPGGKNKSDSFINSFIGDNLSFVCGWLLAKKLNDYGSKKGWYIKHIK